MSKHNMPKLVAGGAAIAGLFVIALVGVDHGGPSGEGVGKGVKTAPVPLPPPPICGALEMALLEARFDHLWAFAELMARSACDRANATSTLAAEADDLADAGAPPTEIEALRQAITRLTSTAAAPPGPCPDEPAAVEVPIGQATLASFARAVASGPAQTGTLVFASPPGVALSPNGYDEGKLSFGFSAGAALGCGFGSSIDVEVDSARKSIQATDLNGDGRVDLQDALRAAASAVRLPLGAAIRTYGPLVPGTTIRSAAGGNAVTGPEGGGVYHALVLDSAPGAFRQHRIWFGWISEGGTAMVIADDDVPDIIGPQGARIAFEVIGTETLAGPYEHIEHGPDEGGGVAPAPDDSVPTAPPEVDATPTTEPQPPTPTTEPKPPTPAPATPGVCKRVAIVFDAGDKDSPARDDLDGLMYLNRAFHRLGTLMHQYLLMHGYVVRRYSNAVDTFIHPNGLPARWRPANPALETAPELIAVIREAAVELARTPCAAGCCHELFVYIVGHGDSNRILPLEDRSWGLHVYTTDPTNSRTVMNSADLLAELDVALAETPHPGCLKLTFFAESCYSGQFLGFGSTTRKAILPNDKVIEGKIPVLCDNLCGLDIYTTSDGLNETMANVGWTVTERFLAKSGTLAERFAAARHDVLTLDLDAEQRRTGQTIVYGSPMGGPQCP